MGGVEKKAHKERRTIVFVDEAGFSLLPAVVRTYAPCGETPISRPADLYAHLAVMSGITLAGQLYTLTREESLTGGESARCLQHLRRKAAEKLWVIWDGSPIHGGEEVKGLLAEA